MCAFCGHVYVSGILPPNSRKSGILDDFLRRDPDFPKSRILLCFSCAQFIIIISLNLYIFIRKY